MDKAEIRARSLQARRAMPYADVELKSRAIIERLMDLPEFTCTGAVLVYVSSKDNEADTHALIERLLAGQRTVLVPIAERDGAMSWSRILSLNELEPGRFGILEPRHEFRRIMDPPNDSVVIVPGVAFSPDGHRIGYGGGYFDRFLEQFTGTTIALAFDAQMVNHIPASEHDVPMDIILTETRVYRRTI